MTSVIGAPLRAVDLFCGAGGLSLGLEQAGLTVELGVDSWDLAVETYRANFNHPCLQSNVSGLHSDDLLALLPAGELDLVAGGPPCQGFSIQRIGADQDARNHLVLEFGRLAVELAPRYILMENVLGLRGVRGRPLLAALIGLLNEYGYQTRVEVVNAADFGVPQARRRVIVFGWREGLPAPLLPVPSSHHMSVWSAIGDLPSPAPPGARDTADPLHIATRLSDLNRKRLAHVPPGGGFEDLPPELRVNAHRLGADVIGHRGVYGRLHPDRPAGTITARFDSFTRGRFAHPVEDRNITLREGARLQTFPDGFGFSGNQEQIAALIGNSVPPRLAYALGLAIVNAEPSSGASPAQSALPLGFGYANGTAG